MQHSETCTSTIGGGTSTIQLRVAIGSEIRMLSITCVRKHPKLLLSSSPTVCLSAEPRRERSINALSEVNQSIMETVVKLTAAVP